MTRTAMAATALGGMVAKFAEMMFLGGIVQAAPAGDGSAASSGARAH